jgi:signal transduction histidine kinase
MAGGIAHDLNNLLQAILGYAQLMGKNPGNVDVVRRGLDVIEKAATGGAETVRRIQKFARLRPEEAFVGLDLDQVFTLEIDADANPAADFTRLQDVLLLVEYEAQF